MLSILISKKDRIEVTYEIASPYSCLVTTSASPYCQRKISTLVSQRAEKVRIFKKENKLQDKKTMEKRQKIASCVKQM